MIAGCAETAVSQACQDPEKVLPVSWQQTTNAPHRWQSRDVPGTHSTRHRPATRLEVDGSAAGVEANARLTSVLGMVLLVLLAVEGFTILSVRQMIKLHLILGLILIGPVVAKCLTTGYRFINYYRGAPAYRHKGPPHVLLRVLGPVVIVTSLAVLGTGGALIYYPDRGAWLTLHKASFILWFGAMTLHVLGHVIEGGRMTVAELRRPALRGRAIRLLAVGAALLAGVGIALAVYPSSSSWISHRGGAYQQLEGH
jgi:hypothetical protein